MRKDLVNEVSQTLGIKNKEVIEKDVILHEILSDLSKDKFFFDNFVFKGGTALVKSYLGYVRFSEDIDFTWKKQNVFVKKSQKKIRSYLSGIIDETGKVFEDITKKRDLDFKCVKSNIDYVELGGSNKFCTFKIWFDSEFRERTFIKVQINFVEKTVFFFQEEAVEKHDLKQQKYTRRNVPRTQRVFQDNRF